MNVANSSAMGIVTLLYYLGTVFLATLLGIFLVLMIHPGDPRLSSGAAAVEPQKLSAVDTILDLIRNMFPENIVVASFERSQTIQRKSVIIMENATEFEITRDVSRQRGINII
ncbi:Amino acid transporter, partial [Trichostrongylus colubriformis]